MCGGGGEGGCKGEGEMAEGITRWGGGESNLRSSTNYTKIPLILQLLKLNVEYCTSSNQNNCILL